MEEKLNKQQQYHGLNKGIEIRKNKLSKKSQQRLKKKPSQVGLVRFVDFQWMMIEKVGGKFRPAGKQHSHGLQVENRIFLPDGHYKMVNNNGLSITQVYAGIPDWATDTLKDKYTHNLLQFAHTTNLAQDQEAGEAAEQGEDQQ